MRFFRVHFYNGADGSGGFKFFTVRAEAAREVARFQRNATDANANVEVEEIQIEPTRADILYALNRYASHPDNG